MPENATFDLLSELLMSLWELANEILVYYRYKFLSLC